MSKIESGDWRWAPALVARGLVPKGRPVYVEMVGRKEIEPGKVMMKIRTVDGRRHNVLNGVGKRADEASIRWARQTQLTDRMGRLLGSMEAILADAEDVITDAIRSELLERVERALGVS